MTNRKLILDVWKQTPKITIPVRQGEVNSRFLDIFLVDGSQQFVLTGKTVMVYMTKPDNKIVFNHCQIINPTVGQIRVALTSQMSIVPGLIANVELHIIGEDKSKLKVTGIDIEVQGSINTDNAIESTNEFSVLTQKIEEANVAIQNANKAAETAATTAAVTATNTVNELKGKPNGIASLNSQGELEQMPNVGKMFLALNPVGSIYMTTIPTNPGTLFGGT